MITEVPLPISQPASRWKGGIVADSLSEGAVTVRKALWHMRHGGLDGLREFQRRRRATAWARPGSRRRGRKGEVVFPPWLLPDPAVVAPRHDLTVGIIADEFTMLALQYEWRTIPLLPGQWREQVVEQPIDLLFVESAWHGNGDSWRYQVVGANGPSSHLRELVEGLRVAGVPTVFWNKEDPAHYEEAIAAARLFDWVFTTDETLLPRYRQDLGHDRVACLPFAAQPTIHNPIRLLGEDGKPEELRDVAFAGMYFAHKYPQRREQMETLLGAAIDVEPKLDTGLDIFSRYLGADTNYQFPEPYAGHVRGSLSYPQMLAAYRGYRVFLNVNSVVDSPSMFARRIFEITACGTPVVTMPSPATSRFLPPGTLAVVNDREEAGHALRALVGNADLRDRMVFLAQREIWLHHTYSERVDQVLHAVGLGEKAAKRPTVAPLVSTIRPERLLGVLETLAMQQEVEQRPVILTHGFEADDVARARARDLGLDVEWMCANLGDRLGRNYNRMLERAEAEYIAKMDDDDLYSRWYLFDSLAAAQYSRAEVVGKHACFMHLEAGDLMVLRFPEWEHRYTAFVAGPTIVARTDLARQVGFPETTTGEDTGFLRSVADAGGRIYSASRFGFVQRREARGGHTWGISSAEVLATGRIAHWGGPGEGELPGESL